MMLHLPYQMMQPWEFMFPNELWVTWQTTFLWVIFQDSRGRLRKINSHGHRTAYRKYVYNASMLQETHHQARALIFTIKL